MKSDQDPRVAASRVRVERSLDELRGALSRATEERLGGRVWALPLLAAAAGFALAFALGRKGSRPQRGSGRRRRRRER